MRFLSQVELATPGSATIEFFRAQDEGPAGTQK